MKKKTSRKKPTNRQLTLAQATKRVSQLTRLGVRAAIVPEATAGKFRVTGAIAQKKKKKAPAKSKKRR